MKRHPRTDEERLRDILEAIARIEAFPIENFEAFQEDDTSHAVLLFNLSVIGEACRYISLELKGAQSDVRWQDFVNTRNMIAHEYFDLDLEEIWATVQKDIPELKKQVEAILNPQPSAETESQSCL